MSGSWGRAAAICALHAWRSLLSRRFIGVLYSRCNTSTEAIKAVNAAAKDSAKVVGPPLSTACYSSQSHDIRTLLVKHRGDQGGD